MIKLVDVYTEIAETRVATKFLYELLKERTITVNISHREMPTVEKHCAFIDSQPYREWFIIFDERGSVEVGPIGSIYLSKQNEIGISIRKDYQGHGCGPLAICTLMKRHPGEQFLANINPHNSRSITMFEGLGFEMLQVTYVKRPTHDIENQNIASASMGPTRPL
jgi:RimJ/RimL family protein N-acetyltransferase